MRVNAACRVYDESYTIYTVIQELYRRAQEYGNLANRACPTAVDMYEAAAEFGLEPKEFKPITRKRKRGAPRTFYD